MLFELKCHIFENTTFNRIIYLSAVISEIELVKWNNQQTFFKFWQR